MKVSFIILLYFAFIFGIFAGCTGTSTSSALSDKIDPIVGSWNYTSPYVDILANFRFTESGQIFVTNKYYQDKIIGNWIKNPDKTYNLYIWNESSTSTYEIYVYDKNTDTIYFQKYPESGFARGLARYTNPFRTAQTNPTVTRTQVVITATPTVNNYQYCRDTYPGSSYNPSTNKCVYPTTVPIKTLTKVVTATPTQDNYQYCRDTYPGSSYNPLTNKCAYPTTVPTKAPTQGSIFKDPIIGTWKTYTRYTSDMIFFENGKGMWGDTVGTWEKIDSTHYSFEYYGATYEGGGYKANRGITYDPRLDTLTFGSQIYKRA